MESRLRFSLKLDTSNSFDHVLHLAEDGRSFGFSNWLFSILVLKYTLGDVIRGWFPFITRALHLSNIRIDLTLLLEPLSEPLEERQLILRRFNFSVCWFFVFGEELIHAFEDRCLGSLFLIRLLRCQPNQFQSILWGELTLVSRTGELSSFQNLGIDLVFLLITRLDPVPTLFHIS